jgi:hypothetical protein
MKPPCRLRLLAALVLAVPLPAQTALLHRSRLPLQAAAAQAPRNEEAALAAGIAATFAYNLDVPHSYDVSVADLRAAARLAPADPRPPWQLGAFFCGSGNGSAQGMALLLQVEHRFPPRRLAPGVWRSYAECAMFAGMPEHALYAEGRLNREHAASSAGDRAVLRQARSLTGAPLPAAITRPVSSGAGNEPLPACFIPATPAVLRFPSASSGGGCFSRCTTTPAPSPSLGPFRGRTAEVTPHLLLLVQPKHSGESLDQFARIRTGGLRLAAVTPPACPVARCRSYAESQPGYYQPEGGGYGLITVFAWRGPKYPGLAFETPHARPQHASPKVQYFTQAPELGRMAPTLYGLVLLDTAVSVRSQAIAAEQAFFAGLRLDAATPPNASRPTPPPGS